MTRSPESESLSRRLKEIMDVVFRLGEVSVAEILKELRDPPTDGAVRRMLNILAEKRLVEARYDGPRKVYRPVQPMDAARRHALRRVAETFFGGSQAHLMASLFEDAAVRLSDEERRTLHRLIERARKQEGV